jgi:hypothetical protein
LTNSILLYSNRVYLFTGSLKGVTKSSVIILNNSLIACLPLDILSFLIIFTRKRNDKAMGINSDAYHNSGRGKKFWEIFDPALITLINAVGLNFFRFLKSLGISAESNLVVLSSRDNYSCKEDELKNARIIINLKRLNLIKHLDFFLNSLVRILPPGSSFIGCFSDEKMLRVSNMQPGRFLRICNRIFHLSGSRTNRIMDRNEVTVLLEKNGFKTLNMKDLNGLTYFISKNVSMPHNLDEMVQLMGES